MWRARRELGPKPIPAPTGGLLVDFLLGAGDWGKRNIECKSYFL